MIFNCNCGVFTLERKKYITKCEYCKNISPVNNNNTNILPQTKINYHWYEKPIVMIRDNAEFRLFINLFCLVGYFVIVPLTYFDHWKIIIISKNKLLHTLFMMFVMPYVLVLFYNLYAMQELNKNKRYAL